MSHKRMEVLVRFIFQGHYGSIRCLLENSDMIESHLRKDGCSRVWSSS